MKMLCKVKCICWRTLVIISIALNTIYCHLPCRQFLIHFMFPLQIPVFSLLEVSRNACIGTTSSDSNAHVSRKLFNSSNFHCSKSLQVLTQVHMFLLLTFSSAPVYSTHFLSIPQNLMDYSHSSFVHSFLSYQAALWAEFNFFKYGSKYYNLKK